MFNVRVYKTIWNREKSEVKNILDNDVDSGEGLKPTAFFYDIVLDFAPFIGLEISSGLWSSGGIQRIKWDAEGRIFYCYTSDEYPSKNTYMSSAPALDFDEDFLKANCLRSGWKQLTSND